MENKSNNIINLVTAVTAVYLLVAVTEIGSIQHVISASGMFILAVFAKIALK